MILGLHHVAISTPDLDRAEAFYCNLLGFEKVMEMQYERSGTPKPHLQSDDGAARAIVVKAGYLYLEIMEYSYPVPNPINPDRQVVDHGLAHICLQIEDMELEYKRLQEAGMVFHSPPMPGLHQDSRFVYGRDPDGNVIELIDFSPEEKFPRVYAKGI